MSALTTVSRVRRLQKIREALAGRGKAAVQVQTPSTDLDRWSHDFLGFVSLLKIRDKSGARVPLIPNTIQRNFEPQRSGRDIVLKPRQVGFTTWELARDVWFFLTRRGARVVVVVQSDKDDSATRNVSDSLRIMFESLAEHGVRLAFATSSISEWSIPERDASLKIVSAGASEAAAEKKGRSGTITRLHVTELAFYEHAQSTMNAMLECVPGIEYGTEIVFESTANGAAGLFYEWYQAAKRGKSAYRPHFFRWLDQAEYSTALDPGEQIIPETDRERELATKHDASPEQIKWYRRKVTDKGSGGQDLADQEYPADEETCWITAGRLFFDKAVTQRLRLAVSEPLSIEFGGALRIWKRPVQGRHYVVVADPSEGTGGDPGAAGVFDRKSGEHVATLHGQFATWEMGRLLAQIGHVYNRAAIVVERNNHGHAVLQALERGQSYPNIYEGYDEKPGWNNTVTTRAAALEAFEAAHRTGAWSTPDKEILAEMLTFIVDKNGKPTAGAGAHDDLVIMAAIANDVLAKPSGLGLVKTTVEVERYRMTGRGY